MFLFFVSKCGKETKYNFLLVSIITSKTLYTFAAQTYILCDEIIYYLQMIKYFAILLWYIFINHELYDAG